MEVLDNDPVELSTAPLDCTNATVTTQSSTGGSDKMPNNVNDISDDSLTKYILRILRSKVTYGWSREQALNELLSMFNFVGDKRIPYKNWGHVLQFIKNIGYEEAKHCKICITTDHVVKLETGEPCFNCGKEWKKAHDYFVLGLRPKSIFLNRSNIKKHLGHWNEKDSWFRRDSITCSRKEVWHGDRFKDLSYFWDSANEFQLPDRCNVCQNILSVSEINNGKPVHGGVDVICEECSSTVTVKQKFVKGSPLNQAFIFHEDSFSAFLRRSRGTATINLTSACCSKINRPETLQVFSFVPTCYLPEGVVHKFDAFLEPLIEQIADLFINGVDINLEEPLAINGDVIPSGPHTVRCLMLLGTADMKAHAEMILYAGGRSNTLFNV